MNKTWAEMNQINQVAEHTHKKQIEDYKKTIYGSLAQGAILKNIKQNYNLDTLEFSWESAKAKEDLVPDSAVELVDGMF